ncbi:MAG TPA: hypothetical protein VF345_06300 [Chthoniobacterales bacterium]
MAEPKKETVRIALPQRPETTHCLQNDAAKHDTARILLPSRTPAIPPRRSPPTITPPSPVNTGTPIISSHRPPVLPPNVAAAPILNRLPTPADATPVLSEAGTTANLLSPADAPVASENFAGVSVQPGPKKETARITILPKPSPAPAPAVNMEKTQSLIPRPAATIVQPSQVVATSNAIDAFDSIPKWFCWGLLGISALIFLIQIWNYALS